MTPTMSSLAFAFCLLVSLVTAHGDGMVMSMDGAMSLTGANMVPYLHFSPGDTIWFLGWVPESKGAMVGACIGLFLLALVDRWLAAIRATAERNWRNRHVKFYLYSNSDIETLDRAQVMMANKLNSPSASKTATSSKLFLITRSTPPFIPTHDIARGILHAGQAALGFAFMLVVMTFQASFIIAIVVGLGVGEMLFGRYISVANAH